MSVARFCVCGFLLPAGSPKFCPACGRDTAPPLTASRLPPSEGSLVSIPPAYPTDAPPLPKKPIAYRTVEVDDDGEPIYDFDGPVNARSAAADAERIRRREVRRNSAENDAWLEREEAIAQIRSRPREINLLNDCFQFPFNSIIWVMILAVSWSALLVLSTFFLWVGYLVVEVFLFAAGVFVLGFTHRIFQYAYASSCAGKAEMLSWPTFRPMAEFREGMRGLLGLCAGPIPVAGLAVWFWLYTGRLYFVDRLILIELSALAFTWWLLVIVASHEFGSVLPGAILQWFDTYGWIPLLVIFGAMTLASIFLWFALAVLGITATLSHEFTVLLAPAMAGIIVLVLVLLRWLGVRRRKATSTTSSPAPA